MKPENGASAPSVGIKHRQRKNILYLEVGKLETTKILTEAQIEAIEKVAELVQQAIVYIVDLIRRMAECIRKIVREIIENYQNKRVIHLALYHKDQKVRKKNWNRIIKWFRRYVRCRG